MKRMTLRSLFFGLPALATCVLLLLAGWMHEQSRPGTSAEYWEYLCGVQLSQFKGHHEYSRQGGVYPVVDGRAYYYAQTHHQQILYSLPVDAVLNDVPLVRASLVDPQAPDPSACAAHPKSNCGYYSDGAGRRAECARRFDSSDSAAFGVEQLEALRLSLSPYSAFSSHQDQGTAAFHERLSRGQRTWVTLAFEGLYIGAWLWFVVGVPPLGLHWRWRLVLSPFLLFLPFFLGYAPMTFTFGPSGGFVYPIYLMLASLPMQLVPCTALDGLIWSHFPDILGGFSQMPGSPLAASNMSCVGPASSLMFGVLLVLVASVFASFRRPRG